MAMLMQLWNDWEIQVLVFLSFVLQVFVFFSGGLRRRSTNTALRLLIWLAYLVADFIAVYALGQLSRQKTDATGVGESHQFAFFWTPFLLIHLGGQDTMTAFSIEDNELWLRHLLNLLVQVGLALYVFWKSSARSQFLIPAIFAFVAGIKYGEKTWALKSASQKALRSSTNGEVDQFPEPKDEQEVSYSTMVKFVLSTAPGVRDIFVGRKVEQMESAVRGTFSRRFYHELSKYEELAVFKILEVELGIMYDSLYTKANMIRTWAGAILRCVTIISLLVAFVLFLTGNKQWHHSRVDVAITYTLFVGAFCLEVSAVFFMVMISPWTWAFFESRKCRRLAHAAWSIFKSVRPKSRPWWSNSMGQYNFLNSCFSDKLIGKIVSLLGAKQIWTNFRHAKHVDVKTDIKKLIFGDQYLGEILSGHPTLHVTGNPTSGVGSALDTILRRPFDESILSLHVYTDLFLHRRMNPANATSCGITKETQHLMDTCRILSEYMFYLLAVHPDMLSVGSSVNDRLEKASETVIKASCTSPSPSKGKFLEKLATDRDVAADYSDPISVAGDVFRGHEEEVVHSHESLEILAHAWVGVLLYAAGKSSGQVHAKQLSMGGELLTFLWLHLAHLDHGDMGIIEIELVRPSAVHEGGRKRFILDVKGSSPWT